MEGNDLFLQYLILKFMYSETATKIWRNLQILFEIKYLVVVSKNGDFVLFLWPSQSIRTLIVTCSNLFLGFVQLRAAL